MTDVVDCIWSQNCILGDPQQQTNISQVKRRKFETIFALRAFVFIQVIIQGISSKKKYNTSSQHWQKIQCFVQTGLAVISLGRCDLTN